MTLAGLVLALGNEGYVYAWLKHIAPWIGFARFPVKFVSIPVFTIPLLAACGVSLFQDAPARKLETQRALSVPGHRLPVIDGYCRADHCSLVARPDARLAVDMVGWRFAGAFLDRHGWSPGRIDSSPAVRLRGLLGFAVLFLVGFDLVTAGMQITPTVVTKAFGPLELNMSSRPTYGESRAMLSRQVASYLILAGTTNPLYYYAGQRGALFENCNIPEHIPKVDGFCSLHLKDEWDIDGILYGAPGRWNANKCPAARPLLDFLGVSQISATNSIFAWQERKSCLPLATAGQQPIFAGDTETMEKLESADFNPRHTVYLPLSARSEVTVTDASEAKVIFQKFGAQYGASHGRGPRYGIGGHCAGVLSQLARLRGRQAGSPFARQSRFPGAGSSRRPARNHAAL